MVAESNWLMVLNSYVGRRGNIGLRAGYLLDFFAGNRKEPLVLARGADPAYRHLVSSSRILGLVARFLNFLRIYVWRSDRLRLADQNLFQFFVSQSLDADPCRPRMCHLWEYGPGMIDLLRLRGVQKILLEVPIAPARVSLSLAEQGILPMPADRFGRMIQWEDQTFHKADRLIVPSTFVRDALVSLCSVPSSKIDIVPFGAKLLAEGLRAGCSTGNGCDFIFMGNVSVRKGVPQLLEAFSSPLFKDDRLHLCGRVYPEVSRWLRDRKLQNVTLHGVIDPLPMLRMGHVFVLPSLLEGSAKSIYEAMAVGLPVITTPNSGSICVDGEDALIVPPGDVGRLRDAMLRLAESPELRTRMGQNARERVKGFTWERYCRSVQNVYCSMEQE